MSFTCRHCNRTSHNPNDALNRYCGYCHHYCDDADLVEEIGRSER